MGGVLAVPTHATHTQVDLNLPTDKEYTALETSLSRTADELRDLEARLRLKLEEATDRNESVRINAPTKSPSKAFPKTPSVHAGFAKASTTSSTTSATAAAADDETEGTFDALLDSSTSSLPPPTPPPSTPTTTTPAPPNPPPPTPTPPAILTLDQTPRKNIKAKKKARFAPSHTGAPSPSPASSKQKPSAKVYPTTPMPSNTRTAVPEKRISFAVASTPKRWEARPAGTPFSFKSRQSVNTPISPWVVQPFGASSEPLSPISPTANNNSQDGQGGMYPHTPSPFVRRHKESLEASLPTPFDVTPARLWPATNGNAAEGAGEDLFSLSSPNIDDDENALFQIGTPLRTPDVVRGPYSFTPAKLRSAAKSASPLDPSLVLFTPTRGPRPSDDDLSELDTSLLSL